MPNDPTMSTIHIYLSAERKRIFHMEAVRRGLTQSEAGEEALDLWLTRGQTESVPPPSGRGSTPQSPASDAPAHSFPKS